MNIVKIEAKEAFDASGNIGLVCCIDLEDGTRVNSRIPSSFFPSVSFTDHEKFITKTIHTINEVFAPALIERVPDVKLMDVIISELNDSNGHDLVHSSVTFLMSSAICKAQAIVYQCEAFELLADLGGAETVCLPFPLISVLDDVAFASNYVLPFKKILLMPLGAPDFKTSCKYAFQVSQEIKNTILEKAPHVCRGLDGGISLTVNSLTEPFDYVVQALKKTGLNEVFVLAIECNVESLYHESKKVYSIAGEDYTPEELCSFYKKLADAYPLFSLEDCFARNDKEGWKLIDDALGETLQLVGNKIFVFTQQDQTIAEQESEEAVSAFVSTVVLQPYKIGTLTENLAIIQALKKANANIVIAHGVLETEETFIADFAVGVSAGQVKVGGLVGSEHVAKYNRLLEIEDVLTTQALEQID